MMSCNSPSGGCQVCPESSWGGGGYDPSASGRFQSGPPSRLAPWQLEQYCAYSSLPRSTRAASRLGKGGTAFWLITTGLRSPEEAQPARVPADTRSAVRPSQSLPAFNEPNPATPT